VYVDDNNENLRAYVKAHPTKKIYRVIRPWNEEIEGTESVFSLLEVYAIQ
jgi:hypothetical protein